MDEDDRERMEFLLRGTQFRHGVLEVFAFDEEPAVRYDRDLQHREGPWFSPTPLLSYLSAVSRLRNVRPNDVCRRLPYEMVGRVPSRRGRESLYVLSYGGIIKLLSRLSDRLTLAGEIKEVLEAMREQSMEQVRNALIQMPEGLAKPPRQGGKQARYFDAVAHAFEGYTIRVVERDGVHWFVVDDLVEPIGYSNANRAIQGVPDSDVQSMYITQDEATRKPRARRQQLMLCVTWEGLERLLLKSEKPAAKRFQDFVHREILKDVREGNAETSETRQEWEVQLEARLELHRAHERRAREAELAKVREELTEQHGALDARLVELEQAQRELQLIKSSDDPYDHTATMVGSLMGVSGSKMNQLALAEGLQRHGTDSSPWRVTPKCSRLGLACEVRGPTGSVRVMWRGPKTADYLTRPAERTGEDA